MKARWFCVSLVLLLQACTVTFVQPYDEKLVDATEAFYKTTALLIEQAREKAPVTRSIEDPANPEANPGHITHYSSFYSRVKIDANALIIRAMVNSEKVDSLALPVHESIEELISKALPSNCDKATAQIEGNITLTLQNYLDLKCLVTHWEVQHQNAPNQVLRKSNWESRQVSLMGMIVSIQKAESFKTQAKVN